VSMSSIEVVNNTFMITFELDLECQRVVASIVTTLLRI
jgi:hypothetical protein